MVVRSREYGLIRELFYSTNPCNRTLAFELAKSTNCYADIVQEFYDALAELPHFELIVRAQQAPYADDDVLVEEQPAVEQQRACIDRFCNIYFHKAMNLNGYNLSGVTAQYLTTFPKVLLQCTFLEELDLSHNDLTEIPAAIGQLTRLKVLNLSSNPHLKALPEAIGELTNLERLDLSGNTHLFLKKDSNTPASYPFPDLLRPLQQLRHLNLQHLRIDALPEWIHEWSYLEALHLYSGTDQYPELVLPQSFTRLRALKTLTVDSFSIRLPNSMDQLHALECLVVNQALWVPQSIAQLKRLKYLDLSYLSQHYASPLPSQPEDQNTTEPLSQLEVLNWSWLLNMSWLEELVFKQTPQWSFTALDRAQLVKALPNCLLNLD